MTEECPNCFGDMAVYNFWWEVIVMDTNSNEFDYECEHCEVVLKVTVEQSPSFIIAVKDGD